MTGTAVELSVDEGVATILLDQPERRNALSDELKRGLGAALDELEETDGPRCVVIEGAGDAFAAGGDIDRMVRLLDSETTDADRAEELSAVTNELIRRIATLPVPTVAKVDGPAVGGGASLAIACDVQLASERSVFGFVFRQVGLAVDTGASYHLPRLVGTNVAKQLLFTGELVGAEEALDIGLVNDVFPGDVFDERVAEFVTEVATGPTKALRHSKRLVDDGLERSLESALDDEATAQGVLFDTADHAEGVAAFVEDRDPAFTGN